VRSLFIPRTYKGQRTPAYLMRLKADALLEAIGGMPDFPVVAETLRECFEDALDVPRLKRILGRLHDAEMWTRHVDTPLPSPFVYPLLLAWDWAYLDAGHAEERRSDAVSMRKAWSVSAGPLRRDIVAGVEAELQKTAPDRRARDANELAAILDDLGDLTRDEIVARTAGDADVLIQALRAEGRITEADFAGGRRAWIPTADAMHYAALATDAGIERVALRLIRTRGPVAADWLAERYGIPRAEAVAALDRLTERGVVRRGEFLAGAPGPQYVHIAVLEEVQRRQVHARRVPRPVATAEQFSAMLLRRHHLHPEHRLAGPTGVLAAVELLQGEDFPARVWEQDLLVPRVEDYQREWLDRLGLAGEIVWTVFEPRETGGPRPGRVGLALRENAGWLRPVPTPRAELDPKVKNVLLHLQLRGASFAQDLARGAGLDTPATLAALWELFWAGLVTPDTFSAVVSWGAPTWSPTPPNARHAPAKPGRSSARRRRGQRRPPLARLPVIGRWSALAEEEALSPEEREEARAHLLLARYGVLSRELAQGDWSTLRHTLLRMEYGGEVVRGYFVEGLSGEQYALEETLRDLETASRRAEPHVLVTIADPANLWGRVFTLTRRDGQRAAAARIPTTWLIARAGRPVLLVEGQGRALTPLAGWEAVDLAGAIRALQAVVAPPLPLRRVRRLDVEEWDGHPIRESEAFDAFVAAGFSVDGPRVSWDGHPGPRWRSS
jgi:ATP-dependent Lhr-like helicase